MSLMLIKGNLSAFCAWIRPHTTNPEWFHSSRQTDLPTVYTPWYSFHWYYYFMDAIFFFCLLHTISFSYKQYRTIKWFLANRFIHTICAIKIPFIGMTISWTRCFLIFAFSDFRSGRPLFIIRLNIVAF